MFASCGRGDPVVPIFHGSKARKKKHYPLAHVKDRCHCAAPCIPLKAYRSEPPKTAESKIREWVVLDTLVVSWNGTKKSRYDRWTSGAIQTGLMSTVRLPIILSLSTRTLGGYFFQAH